MNGIIGTIVLVTQMNSLNGITTRYEQIRQDMGLSIVFVFEDGDAIDAYMGYSSFPQKILIQLPEEDLLEWIPHWTDGKDKQDGKYMHKCRFVKLIYQICKAMDYLEEDKEGDPIGMIFC